jgi:transposase, IS605 orfB family
MYQVLKLRIYRKHYVKLDKLSSAVNFVWNYVNNLCWQMWRRKRIFPSAYDIHEYTKGAGEELGLHSQTIQFIGEKHHQSRKQHKKVKLAWRTNRPDAESNKSIDF